MKSRPVKYSDISVDEVEELLRYPDLLILDYRDAQTFAQGHITAAVNVSNELVGRLMREKVFDQPLLVYCYHGNSSRELAGLLAMIGYRRVYNLVDGWQAWQNHQQRLAVAAVDPHLKAWLVKNGFQPPTPGATVRNSMTPLMLAALQGEAMIVTLLLQAGIDINRRNDDDNNALWFACVGNHPAVARQLIDQGIDIDNQNVNGATCLIYAASAGKSAMVRLLVEAGADLQCTTLDDFTALDSATTLPILKYLKPHYTRPGEHP